MHDLAHKLSQLNCSISGMGKPDNQTSSSFADGRRRVTRGAFLGSTAMLVGAKAAQAPDADAATSPDVEDHDANALAHPVLRARVDKVERTGVAATHGRVTFGLQGSGEMVPGAGIVRVEAAAGRSLELTHYSYGCTIRTVGPHSELMELFLGSAGTPAPTFSVRGNGQNLGARIHCRNAGDTAGLILDYETEARPRLALTGAGVAPAAVLVIENPAIGGEVRIATKGALGVCVDRLGISETHGVFATGNSFFNTSGGGYRVSGNVVINGTRDVMANSLRDTSSSQALVTLGVNTLGFYGATPVAKQSGVAATAAGIHSALVNLGLIAG